MSRSMYIIETISLEEVINDSPRNSVEKITHVTMNSPCNTHVIKDSIIGVAKIIH